MFVNDEKSMEDYIVQDDSFIETLAGIMFLRDVKLVGRQVHLGTHNIIDLLYEGYGDAPFNEDYRTLVAVELKFRTLQEKDLAQIGRYRSALKHYFNNEVDVQGVLVGTGITTDFAHILNGKFLDAGISFITIDSEITYRDISYESWDVIDISGNIESSLKEIKDDLSVKKGDDDD